MAIVKPASCGDRAPVPEADPSDQPSRVLKTIFGLSGFRGEQQAIIEHVVAGGDAIVLMPTGGGPCLERPRRARVKGNEAIIACSHVYGLLNA